MIHSWIYICYVFGFVTCLWIIFGPNLWDSWVSLFITSFPVQVWDFAEYKAHLVYIEGKLCVRRRKRQAVGDYHGIGWVGWRPSSGGSYKQMLWPGSKSVSASVSLSETPFDRFYNSLNLIIINITITIHILHIFGGQFVSLKKSGCDLVTWHISRRLTT